METGKSADVLAQMLREAGVDLDAPRAEDVPVVWETFQRFAEIEADDAAAEGEGLLVQYGTYNWGAGKNFELDFTRQFTYEEDGEYAGMAQLHCTLRFKPKRKLRKLGHANLWSFELERDEFYARAVALPGFAFVLAERPQPREIEVFFEHI